MNEFPNNLAPAPPRRRVSLLFWLNLLIAAGLVALVLASPLLTESNGSRLVKVFASDSAVRQTAIAGAIGLTVTAFVFFRRRDGSEVESHRAPPSNVVGA